MTVPSRREAASVLRSLSPSAKFVRHACAVGDVAAFLAMRVDQQGHPVDRRLVETAALLHDVDKLASAGAPAHLRHGEGSAAWLEARGLAELAPAVRDHPVTRLAEPGFEDWPATAPLEARIVAYADKRAAQHLAPMDARFARWRRKYPPGLGQDRPARRRLGVDGGHVRARGAACPRAGATRVRRGRDPPRPGPAPPVVAPSLAGDRAVSADVPVIAYFRGDDGYTMDAAVMALARRLEAESGTPPDRWRANGVETDVASIGMRVATAPLFGGGTVAVIVDPAPLLRSKADREAMERAIGNVAPGNALVFIEQGDAGARRPAALQGLETAVLKAGGDAKAFKAPREGQLAAWIEARASERSMTLGPGAAKELARRVGGFVREGDVDRQRQGALAVGELEKLALYRPFDPVTEADVRSLVAEVVPDSTWAFLDAVAERKPAVAGPLLDRLLETTPEPVVLVQLHRRIRELLEVADHLAGGATAGSLVRTLGMKPFRVEKLVGQARRWTLAELDDALEGLLDLDAMVKGAPDSAATDAQRRLAFSLWIRERVAPVAPSPAAAAARSRRRAGGSGRQSAEDQASSCRTTSLWIANTHRPSDRSSSSISSGSMYSWWQSSHSPPGIPKHRRSVRSGSRNVVSKRVMMRRRVQPGQRSRRPDMGALRVTVASTPTVERLARDARNGVARVTWPRGTEDGGTRVGASARRPLLHAEDGLRA